MKRTIILASLMLTACSGQVSEQIETTQVLSDNLESVSKLATSYLYDADNIEKHGYDRSQTNWFGESISTIELEANEAIEMCTIHYQYCTRAEEKIQELWDLYNEIRLSEGPVICDKDPTKTWIAHLNGEITYEEWSRSSDE